jgi:starch synthase
MSSPLQVIYVTPEAAPWAKSGELADVAGSLPKALAEQGAKVSVFLPCYRRPEIESLPKKRLNIKLSVPVGDIRLRCRVQKAEPGKFDLYLIDHPPYFWREHIYGTGREDYLDNDERFVFFARAVLEFLSQARLPVDIVHCNNWPAALIPVFMRTHYKRLKRFQQAGSLLSLHNVRYQGDFPLDSLTLTGLSWKHFDFDPPFFRGRFNFLKAGVAYADAIHTVSSSYRKDILSAKHGFGMNEALAYRRKDLSSIRNGIDYETWDPGSDDFLAANYRPPDFHGKAICRQDLIREMGLRIGERACIVGVISYFTPHKGFEILAEALEGLMSLDIALIVLGQGEAEFERKFHQAQRRWPGKVVLRLGFSPGEIHRLLAGADVILIPSFHEPCGLNQMYGFRYGTVPVIRVAGGLKETVRPYGPGQLDGDGFVFRDFSAAALTASVRQAVRVFRKPRSWSRLMRAGTRKNFSWEKSAHRFMRLYHNILESKRGGHVV